MKIKGIESFSFESTCWETYNLIFVASGFEERSTHLATHIPNENLDQLKVIGFDDNRDTLSRAKNDKWFTERTRRPIHIPISTNEVEQLIYGSLNSLTSDTVKIAVDYSAMTRDWYGRILTWARYQTKFKEVTVDFFYSHGSYCSKFDHLQIKDIVCVPGYEGVGAGARFTTAFFGLGFDGGATSTVGELIEADRTICFVARGGAVDPHADEVTSKNSEIIRESNADLIYLPLSDVRRATSILLENIGKYCNDSDKVLVIPMGPKPHILASLLACQIVPSAACLHVRGARGTPVQVTASGEIACTRVQY